MLNELFDKVYRTSCDPIDEQIIGMLQQTWPRISTICCESAIGRAKYGGDTAELRVTSDEARTAVYSSLMMYSGKKSCRALDEWFDLTPRQQNSMLIRAFPDGRTYLV
jgi:hypothetical protein